MLDRLFKWGKKKPLIRPAIQFGRYSDNNKSEKQADLWAEAESLFKEKKYYESLIKFFEYLKDDELNNVTFQRDGTHFKFEIYQGSKVVRGSGGPKHLHAKVILARMQQPSVPVMRRLLEQNFNLYYSRYSLNSDKLIMQFDSDLETANPNKLYYALKELATTADKQDDLLVQDFHSLAKLDTEHVEEMPISEKEIRYNFMIKWIGETLANIKGLDPEKYTGGISYLLLALLYRIDFLIKPEGSLMNEIEKTQAIYFRKDNLSNIEKNRLMLQAVEKLHQKTSDDVYKDLFRSTSTFSIRRPKDHKHVIEAISNTVNSMNWYRENKYPEIARQISEYGISYSQYTFSVPRPLTEFFQLFMEVNYKDYFMALGFSEEYVDTAGKLQEEAIEEAIDAINRKWKSRYRNLNFKTGKLRYDDMVNFNHSFTTAITELNFENA